MSPRRSFTNYVRFDNLSTSIGYEFSVYASNQHGLSLEHSTIYIPSELDSKSSLYYLPYGKLLFIS